MLLCSPGIWAKTTVLEVTIQCSKHTLNTHNVTSPEHFPVEQRGEEKKKKQKYSVISPVVKFCVKGHKSPRERVSSLAWRGSQERNEKEIIIRTGVGSVLPSMTPYGARLRG